MTAQALFDHISRDISDRRGLKREWDAIDADVMEEIRMTWVAVFDAALAEEREAMRERCARECDAADAETIKEYERAERSASDNPALVCGLLGTRLGLLTARDRIRGLR